MRKKYTNTELLKGLKLLSSELKKENITNVEVNSCNYLPTVGVLVQRFGSFNEAKRKAGLITNNPHQKHWSEEDIVSMFKEVTKQAGGYLTTAQIAQEKKLPSPQIIKKYFGSISNLRRRAGTKSKLYSKPRWFSNIDEKCEDCDWTSDFAYIWGFWLADGCLSRNYEKLVISFTNQDNILLGKIKKVLQLDNILTKCKSNKYPNSIWYTFGSRNSELISKIIRYGGTERKSLSARLPNRSEYFYDFLRGYFDGDGSIGNYRIRKDRSYTTLKIQFTSGSELLLDQIKTKLINDGIHCQIFKKFDKRNFTLTLHSNQSKELCRRMYERVEKGKTDLFMARKYEIYKNAIHQSNAVSVIKGGEGELN